MASKEVLTTGKIISNAASIFHRNRWKFGIVVCPYCGSVHVKEYDGYRYRCMDCKNRFSDKTNTLLHGSKLSVSIWLQAIYEIISDNFISSITLSNKLGINQKSAWLLRAKIDFAMDLKDVQLGEVVCMDEMYIGGCISNFHYRRKLRLLRENGLLDEDRRDYDKSAIYTLNKRLRTQVFGMTDGDKVVLHVCPNPIKKEHVRKLFKRHCKRTRVAISDESQLYLNWEENTGTELQTNNHHDNQYITKDGYTSNPIENKFSWFKRGFYSRITHCKYHQLYLNEYCYRYNTRNMTTEERIKGVIEGTIGKHLTYNTIRAYNALYEVESKSQMAKKERRKNRTLRTFKWALEAGIATSFVYEGRKYTLKDFK